MYEWLCSTNLTSLTTTTVAVSALFFKEPSDVLDRLVNFIDPVFVVVYFNVRLDRPSDPDAGQFNELFTAYGLVIRVTTVTHVRGGILDTVATHNDLPSPHVDVIDVDLSDRRLLRRRSSFVLVQSTRRSHVGHGVNLTVQRLKLLFVRRRWPVCGASTANAPDPNFQPCQAVVRTARFVD